MPDENKIQALTNAGFVVRRTCLRCVHFKKTIGYWGTCNITPYGHLKHSGPPRCASVPSDGSCPRHELDNSAETFLGAHIRFIESEHGE